MNQRHGRPEEAGDRIIFRLLNIKTRVRLYGLFPSRHPSCLPNTRPDAPGRSQTNMTKDYEQLWNGVTRTTDEAQAVLALAEILADM